MKKIFALFVMAIFLISAIPLAFAQQEGPVATQYRTQNGSEPEPRLVQARQQVRSDAREVRQDGRELRSDARQGRADTIQLRKDTRARMEALKERIKNRFQERPVRPVVRAKAKLVKAREMYQQAKQKYIDAKEKYKEERGKFVDAKEKWKACKGDNSEECEQQREKLKAEAKPHLLRSADMVLKELERVKAKVESSEDLSDEEIAELDGDLDEKIAEVEDAKATIENLGEDSTKEDINAAAKTIREAWKGTKVDLKKTVGRLAGARLGNILLQIEKLEERFDNARDKLAEQGKDVSKLDSILDDFSAKLDEGADKYNQAKDLWKEAHTAGEVDDAAKEVHELMKEAQEALKDSKGLLREAVTEIRNLNKGSLDVAESDDEGMNEEDMDGEADVEEEEEVEEEDACTTDADCETNKFCNEGKCENLEEEVDGENQTDDATSENNEGSEEDSNAEGEEE